MSFVKYIPYATDAGLLLVHAAGLAVMKEDQSVKAADRRAAVIQCIKEQLNKPGGIDLPAPLNNDFTIGLAVDVSVKVMNMVGFSKFFNSLKLG